jgi:hypothetical protein
MLVPAANTVAVQINLSTRDTPGPPITSRSITWHSQSGPAAESGPRDAVPSQALSWAVGHHEEARQVDAHDQLVIVDRVVRERLANEDPRIVHQRVDAPERSSAPMTIRSAVAGWKMSLSRSGRPGRRMA